MKVDLLEKYLPLNALPIIKNWIGDFHIHIKITKERSSKLGDYRKMGENKFIITINHNLPPELFFLVFTHEMAHLFAFENFSRKKIAPHGREWKDTFRQLLLDTLHIYSQAVQPLILEYAAVPTASLSASTGLKRHFYPENLAENELFVEQLQMGEIFWYREIKYKLENRRRKNFVCTQVSTGEEYVFRPIVKVRRVVNTYAECDLNRNCELPANREVFVNQLKNGDGFTFNNIRFLLEKKRRINYLCLNEQSGEYYIFPPFIKVKKIS